MIHGTGANPRHLPPGVTTAITGTTDSMAGGCDTYIRRSERRSCGEKVARQPESLPRSASTIGQSPSLGVSPFYESRDDAARYRSNRHPRRRPIAAGQRTAAGRNGKGALEFESTQLILEVSDRADKRASPPSSVAARRNPPTRCRKKPYAILLRHISVERCAPLWGRSLSPGPPVSPTMRFAPVARAPLKEFSKAASA